MEEENKEAATAENLHLMLGLPESSSILEIKQAYTKLLKVLYTSELAKTKSGLNRLREVRLRVNQALEHLRQIRPESNQPSTRPKIGQLLIAAGLLTLEQLDAALEIQRNTQSHHVFIGQILLESGYITDSQLEYHLKQQEVLLLPPDHQQRWGQRLVALGLVSDDQLHVALIEQQSKSISLRQALINRGWLTEEVLDRIF